MPLRQVPLPPGCDTSVGVFYQMRRAQVPEADPFSVVTDALYYRLAAGSLYVTVASEEGHASFASDNWAHFGPLMGKLRLAMEEAPERSCLAIVVRRFEDGPKDPISKLPYKTVAGLFFGIPKGGRAADGRWCELSEEAMKASHRTDPTTMQPDKGEQSVLFSTISEMMPEVRKPGCWRD